MVSTAELLARPIALDAWQAVLRPARVVFGAGRLAELGALVAELGGARALLVTDPGLEAAGHVGTAMESLGAASIDAVVFDEVAENPTTEHVEAAAAVGRAHGADFIVGLGGGSALDCAKGANFLLTNGGRIEDYWGWNRASRPMLPSIGVPSTAGTGSEAQSYALIAQAASHRKMACGDEKARFTAVILDPLLPRTAPRTVTAIAGYDALSHAVESLVSRTANPLSRLFSREAWRLLERSYEVGRGRGRRKRWRGRRDRLVRPAAGRASRGRRDRGVDAGRRARLRQPAHRAVRRDARRRVALMLPAVVRANAPVVARGLWRADRRASERTPPKRWRADSKRCARRAACRRGSRASASRSTRCRAGGRRARAVDAATQSARARRSRSARALSVHLLNE